ncbi:hypothetical protein BMS_1783 [Halobacteriovorax marinus SJ]|uniref:Uncharacterized protein n=1 Tax=Halobacteriovorax marinus (strain ATCC BAA-682 / DSM 15412 / SJ) TaxID=862908 RepID=E1X1U8_HALMS|nr:hypothetical protein [Halobacteriovorax marinus]CBW26608.1 hypothetical protein BMS_1783 [Halobacteriovorax marinus SJ]
MSLEVLNINFQNKDEFLNEINGALFHGKEVKFHKKELSFDSIETFKRVMSQNKLQILMAISRLKPESVYQLEKSLLNRKYPHILKDCRQLESLGFIRLVESKGSKRQLRPELTFAYDIIKVNSKNPELIEIFNISLRSNRVLLEANAG